MKTKADRFLMVRRWKVVLALGLGFTTAVSVPGTITEFPITYPTRATPTSHASAHGGSTHDRDIEALGHPEVSYGRIAALREAD